jgi:hypothetical protein
MKSVVRRISRIASPQLPANSLSSHYTMLAASSRWTSAFVYR